ncbi:SIR2 family NAD-dependent protein deacylase [Comamonas terrigena]|uniref:SIR2 family NAD-dependent protein deacylase n=1 Tax=Comamonas terrigena TaxID=32013 RepID=UPI0028996AC2|nr:SIR2 family protein [Comamonas terrigena]
MSTETKSNPTLQGKTEASQLQNTSMAPKEYADEVHLRAIRKALANGNAAVMVGSGFSRNAEGGSSVGTWDDLAQALATGMNDGKSKASFSAANATQLAEQYERLFSRPALEQVLRQVVPDERLAPGQLHSALLSLPWSEVLTTNYDTLLERTAEKLVDSTYFTICCREDIPQSKVLGRRRIVKLHGSFASHRPFIVTEEDYRKYPEEFAPFVNLVRQSLLENVMCLVGFSGDDPNFLHWIGWVRDMQDRHALPIYLLLSKAPSLGQRMLLQARGVTPLVLPLSDNDEESDYEGRYRRLFEVLAEPLEGNIKQWGVIPWLDAHRRHHESLDERYKTFISSLQLLSQQRHEYPGWLVAPQRVRGRLEGSIRGTGVWFDDKWVVERLEGDQPALALAALGLYAWIQKTILDDLNDDTALLALRILKKTTELHFSQLSKEVCDHLKEFRVNTQNALADNWTNLALEVMIWARRGHWENHYIEIISLLKKWRNSDPQVHDHIAYQTVLKLLHEGSRIEANRVLTRWQIRGSDLYMEVRRAVLVAELGNITEALTICERTVQILRQQQRLRPDDPRLLSEESWACLVATRLQDTVEQLKRFGMAVDDEETTEAVSIRTPLQQDTANSFTPAITSPSKNRPDDGRKTENFDTRLKTLGNRGYASDEEVRLALESLREEAGVPQAENYPYNSFSLGSSSKTRTFGIPLALRRKIHAASAWLQLAERVGLIPNAGRMNLHSDAFMQAAWWLRYIEADPYRRGLGILFRCRKEDVLKPTNNTLPQHMTGWLSRLQVAGLSANFAELHTEEFFIYIEYILATPQRAHDSQRDLKFFAEVFGRLVLRVEDQAKLLDWGERLITAHSLRGAQSEPRCWAPLGRALTQCVEALTPLNQRRILLLAYQVSQPMQEGRNNLFHADWLNIYSIYSKIEPLQEKDKWSKLDWNPVLTELIERLIVTNESSDKSELWLRIFVADELQLLDVTQRQKIGNFLWSRWDGITWPLMNGFNPHATLKWPPPPSIDVELAYISSLLNMQFRPFSASGNMTFSTGGGRSWSLNGNYSLSNALLIGLDRYSWPIKDLDILVSRLEDWIDADGPDLLRDIPKSEDLATAVISHIEKIDEILSRAFIAISKVQRRKGTAAVVRRIWALHEKLSQFRLPLWRLSLLKAVHTGDEMQLLAVHGSLQFDITSRDENVIENAYKASSWLLKQSNLDCSFLFDGLVSVISGKIMPALVWALEIISIQPKEVWMRYLTHRRLFLLDAALGQLRKDLKIFDRPAMSGIPDDAVTTLRFKCAQLAYALNLFSGYESPNASKWLKEAQSDPLPELRLSRFRSRVEHTGLKG